jgi:hypothetical protein
VPKGPESALEPTYPQYLALISPQHGWRGTARGRTLRTLTRQNLELKDAGRTE